MGYDNPGKNSPIRYINIARPSTGLRKIRIAVRYGQIQIFSLNSGSGGTFLDPYKLLGFVFKTNRTSTFLPACSRNHWDLVYFRVASLLLSWEPPIRVTASRVMCLPANVITRTPNPKNLRHKHPFHQPVFAAAQLGFCPKARPSWGQTRQFPRGRTGRSPYNEEELSCPQDRRSQSCPIPVWVTQGKYWKKNSFFMKFCKELRTFFFWQPLKLMEFYCRNGWKFQGKSVCFSTKNWTTWKTSCC